MNFLRYKHNWGQLTCSTKVHKFLKRSLANRGHHLTNFVLGYNNEFGNKLEPSILREKKEANRQNNESIFRSASQMDT